MQCVACHNMTLNLMFITSELAHVTMSSQEYRLSREKIGQLRRYEITTFPDLDPTLPKSFSASSGSFP